jgi:hypothetical protein
MQPWLLTLELISKLENYAKKVGVGVVVWVWVWVQLCGCGCVGLGVHDINDSKLGFTPKHFCLFKSQLQSFKDLGVLSDLLCSIIFDSKFFPSHLHCLLLVLFAIKRAIKN